MGSSEIEPCGFTGSNQRGTLISVKFKITLPSSLMKHNSSNQKVPWTCHSGSPQTGHSNATKGLPSTGGSERGGPASQTLGAPDATDRAPLQAVGGGGGVTAIQGEPATPTTPAPLLLHAASSQVGAMKTSRGSAPPAGHPDPSSPRGSPPPGHTSRGGWELMKTQAMSSGLSLPPSTQWVYVCP